MKKITTMAYVAALALVSTAGLTSCSNDEPGNGNYNGETVKTEFSIALPDEAVGGSPVLGPNRMPSTTVQIGGRSEFQGMTGITLVPFATTVDVVSSDSRLGTNITLSDIANASALGTNSNAKVYPNTSIPLSTASFLFYAQSAATGSNFEKGALNAVNLTSTNPSAFEFNLQPIVATFGSPTGTGTTGEALIAYLNSVADATDGTKAWKNYSAGTPAEATMAALFNSYKSFKCLSSANVERMMTDLYNSLNAMSTTLAANIKTAIASSTYAAVSGSGPYTVTLKNSAPDYSNFPGEYSLPQGSVLVKWDGSAFVACAVADYEDANATPLDKYTYPASLWYYANSQIKTSNTSKQAMYNSSNDWATILAAHANGTYVSPATRAVAIEDVIQYGVARLDVIVKLAGTTLNDNTPTTPQSISCSSYPVTAVFIGGQKNVGFDFTPKGATEYTIYDSVMTSALTATTTNANANSTLVLESEVGPTKNVKIAIELTNASGQDFVGQDGNIIFAGNKFYLVAELKAAAGEGSNKTGDVNPNQVFKKDYTTTATLTIASLKSAYNTIPDLRNPQLELGMSVDLQWTPGNTYTVTIE